MTRYVAASLFPTMKRFRFLNILMDLIAPRPCLICGWRLDEDEQFLCVACNTQLPRTGFAAVAEDNEMARLFYGRIPIERCAALFFYRPQSNTSHLIHKLKYEHQPEIGTLLGRMTAREFIKNDFFEDIDLIIPVPITRDRCRQRGYNQASLIAQGVHEVTGIPVDETVVVRENFTSSQTDKHRLERMDNVENAFRALDTSSCEGRHILLVDDVVTTGATIVSCAQEIVRHANVKVSVLALAFTKN